MCGPARRNSLTRRVVGSTRRATTVSSNSSKTGARGVLVGATTVGPCGGEMLGIVALAVHAEIPTARLREMIYAYPTFHRGIDDALRELA